MPRLIGLLVNPVAGMGGSVALKGTDGAETAARARELGAEPHAPLRMGQALDAAMPLPDDVEFLTCGGEMGERLLKERKLPYRTVYTPKAVSDADDTKSAVRAMAAAGAEFIFFAGGDGTARDVCAALNGAQIPAAGVPAGVKIHSAVYGINPVRAGQLLHKFAEGLVKDYTEGEVMDIDEEAFRRGIVRAQLYGYLKVPLDRSCLQDRKSGGTQKDVYEQSAIGTWCAENMKPGRLYLIGSGTTTKSVLDALKLEGTLLGVDAVKDRRLIGRDLTEKQILGLLEPGNTTLIVTVIGGQGHIFGRGNQQLSPAVLKEIGPDNILVIATPAKLDGLFPRPLLVDTGDEELDRTFCGYKQVVTGYNRTQMWRVEC
jgi:predicted polyphosphate/ATP-dependent NAD kinase